MTKKRIEDLSIFGGESAFEDTLHVGRPNIGNRERLFGKINGLLDRSWLTNKGPLVSEFEERVAKFIGVRNCISMCNGTIALEIAARALGLKGEVIIPSFTFIATAHSLQWQEITPVFCDIEPGTCNIDPAKVEQLITPRTTGIIGVHIWGRPCQIEQFKTIACKHKLQLLFDASHAFGCGFNGTMLGGFGDAEVFSFHATKIINSFEGGAIVTNNDDLAQKIRLMKNFGFAGMDNVIYIGTNGKMNEVAAAMGLNSLESLNEFIEINYQNYQKYRTELAGIPGINMLNYDEREKQNFHYIVIKVDDKKTGISRDQLMRILHAENIRVRRYFYPGCHRMEPYRSYYPNAGLLLPETEKIVKQVLCLPTGKTVHTEDIDKICQIIRFVVEKSVEINQCLFT